MKTRIVIFVTAVTALGILGGCDRARTASEVAADTASAEQSAMQKDAAAAKDANEKVTKAGQEVRSDRRQLTHEAAVQNQKRTRIWMWRWRSPSRCALARIRTSKHFLCSPGALRLAVRPSAQRLV